MIPEGSYTPSRVGTFGGLKWVNRMRSFLALISVLGFSVPSIAATIIVHDGRGRECYEANLPPQSPEKDRNGMAACAQALASANDDTRFRVAAFVNRSDIRLRMKDFEGAASDAGQAIALEPQLAVAHLNRGAALVGLQRDADAISALDKAISIGSDTPELAYFNRALAKEHSGDIKGAFLDYRMALQANPKFQLAADELTRFKVVTK
jgi:tetratricopeptide (TPR) repeat protein